MEIVGSCTLFSMLPLLTLVVLQSPHDQHIFAGIWKGLHPNSKVFFEPTIRGALQKVKEIGKGHGSVQTLVTGSLYLVGGALSFLESSPA
jgi:hypothetical protein